MLRAVQKIKKRLKKKDNANYDKLKVMMFIIECLFLKHNWNQLHDL